MPDTTPKTRDGYVLNAQADIPDIRDWPYEPALVQLKSSINPPPAPIILQQGSEGSCTGCGLAAVINLLNQRRGNMMRVSERMLYEMAKRYDEWEGHKYSGSSCRGAIKGWYNMGVCDEKLWGYRPNRPGRLSLKRAKAARENTIGAYYRVNHRISDFHAALNEVEVVYASADVHEGWDNVDPATGIIPFDSALHHDGSHAFAIVGYDSTGFWIQNSWSRNWGKGGLAHWSYEDWQHNIIDAWVLRLALPTPQVWHLPVTPSSGSEELTELKRAPSRGEIAGHFVHIDDGEFHEHGKYWSSPDDTEETAELLIKSDKYDHLLFYAHGGLNGVKASARRILAMKTILKQNRIYPYHFMYDTGIMEELRDVVFGKRPRLDSRVGSLSDASDQLVETMTRIPGRALWREMKADAEKPFDGQQAGTLVLRRFLKALRKRTKPAINIHLVGHSTGSILLAYLLERLAKLSGAPRIASVTLMAPAATVQLFEDMYVPLLHAGANAFGVDKMQIMNLNERLELDDDVGGIYRKSLLYLVSRAFEEDAPRPLLGMELHKASLPAAPQLTAIYSDGPGGAENRSSAASHSDFDNDVATMNHIIRTVTGRDPSPAFTRQDLDY